MRGRWPMMRLWRTSTAVWVAGSLATGLATTAALCSLRWGSPEHSGARYGMVIAGTASLALWVGSTAGLWYLRRQIDRCGRLARRLARRITHTRHQLRRAAGVRDHQADGGLSRLDKRDLAQAAAGLARCLQSVRQELAEARSAASWAHCKSDDLASSVAHLQGALDTLGESFRRGRELVHRVDHLAYQVGLAALNADLQAVRTARGQDPCPADLNDNARRLADCSGQAARRVSSWSREVLDGVGPQDLAGEDLGCDLRELAASNRRSNLLLGRLAEQVTTAARLADRLTSRLEEADEASAAAAIGGDSNPVGVPGRSLDSTCRAVEHLSDALAASGEDVRVNQGFFRTLPSAVLPS